LVLGPTKYDAIVPKASRGVNHHSCRKSYPVSGRSGEPGRGRRCFSRQGRITPVGGSSRAAAQAAKLDGAEARLSLASGPAVVLFSPSAYSRNRGSGPDRHTVRRSMVPEIHSRNGAYQSCRDKHPTPPCRSNVSHLISGICTIHMGPPPHCHHIARLAARHPFDSQFRAAVLPGDWRRSSGRSRCRRMSR
jgi:hypothetical protein